MPFFFLRGICSKASVVLYKYDSMKASSSGRMVDALAHGGDEGRDKLRQAAGRSKYPLIRGFPNGTTRQSVGLTSVHKYRG